MPKRGACTRFPLCWQSSSRRRRDKRTLAHSVSSAIRNDFLFLNSVWSCSLASSKMCRFTEWKHILAQFLIVKVRNKCRNLRTQGYWTEKIEFPTHPQKLIQYAVFGTPSPAYRAFLFGRPQRAKAYQRRLNRKCKCPLNIGAPKRPGKFDGPISARKSCSRLLLIQKNKFLKIVFSPSALDLPGCCYKQFHWNYHLYFMRQVLNGVSPPRSYHWSDVSVSDAEKCILSVAKFRPKYFTEKLAKSIANDFVHHKNR